MPAAFLLLHNYSRKIGHLLFLNLCWYIRCRPIPRTFACFILVCDGTQLCCGENFIKEEWKTHAACITILLLTVLPTPKVLQKSHDIAAVTTDEFTCKFKAKHNSKVLQVYWLYNISEIQQYIQETN